MSDRQLLAATMILRAIDESYLPSLNCSELLHFNMVMDAPIRTAHALAGLTIREKDEKGNACSAQDALKLALAYYNPAREGDITMKYAPDKYVPPKRTLGRWLRHLFYRFIFETK